MKTGRTKTKPSRNRRPSIFTMIRFIRRYGGPRQRDGLLAAVELLYRVVGRQKGGAG